VTPRIILTAPDDFHLHLRDGAAMADAVAHTARVFRRAVIMPNLKPPLVTTDQAIAYRSRIEAALPEGASFEPLMTLYLTDSTTPAEIVRASASGAVAAVKLYPAGATTHSDAGVADLQKLDATLTAIEEHGLPLLVHGEVTDPEVDIFDRERMFIDTLLAPLVDRYEGLKVVFEHVTTREAVDFVTAAPSRVAATVTPHHLLLDRNALFAGGFDPHHYCLPVLKSERHRQALVAAATGDDPSFFLGTDSAPHSRLELYAEVFEGAGALDRLDAFAGQRGADFYGRPRNKGRVTLVREEWLVPDSYPFGDGEVIPLRAGETIKWRVIDT